MIAPIRWERHRLLLLDQTLLPVEERTREYTRWRDVADAIRTLVVRGAPAIGCAAAFGVALAARQSAARDGEGLVADLEEAIKGLAATRPTAVNLFWALDRMRGVAEAHRALPVPALRERLLGEAQAILDEDLAANKALGAHGAALVPERARILTHCNAGALGFQDHGTALAVVRFAHIAGKRPHVYVSKTRPWLQGSRLTTWELQQEGIPHELVVDSVCAWLFQQKRVDAVIVGADRIAANGDVANKIGTYDKAVLAHEHGVPFYVAAPTNTFDLSTPNGQGIEIEERTAQEVLTVVGRLRSKRIDSVQVAPDGTSALNPVFDVTPVKYVTGFITERGVLTNASPAKIERLLGPRSEDS